MLYDKAGNRKYLTALERRRFIEAARQQVPVVETFCLTLAYTGARISEVLALRASNIDPAAGTIVIESLKKRRTGIFRQVPVPSQLLRRLDGADDAAVIARFMQPQFGPLDLINLPNHHFYLRQMIDGTPSVPFSAKARVAQWAE